MLKLTVLVLCCIWIQCQAQVDPCETLICENGGICILSFDRKSATCECACGWEGMFCDIDSDNSKQHREEQAIIIELDDYEFSALRPSYDHPEQSKMNSNGFVIETPVRETNSIMSKPFRSVFDMDSWIQAEFFMTRQIHRVITMGHAEEPYWIQKYRIAHSVYGDDWFWVHSVETEEVVEFKGNTDKDTAVSRSIPGHREIGYIRLYPVECHGQCAVRWEIYGCAVVITTTIEPTMAPTESDESSSEENAAAILNPMSGHLFLFFSIIAHLMIRQF